LLSIGYGAVCGWPSAGTLLLMSDESPLPTGKVTMEEASWITAMICVGGFIGNFVFAWIAERYGRKIPLLLAAVFQIVRKMKLLKMSQ
jgi:MFS family permease